MNYCYTILFNIGNPSRESVEKIAIHWQVLFQQSFTSIGGIIAIPVIIHKSLCMGGDTVGLSELIQTALFTVGMATIAQSVIGIRWVNPSLYFKFFYNLSNAACSISLMIRGIRMWLYNLKYNHFWTCPKLFHLFEVILLPNQFIGFIAFIVYTWMRMLQGRPQDIF